MAQRCTASRMNNEQMIDNLSILSFGKTSGKLLQASIHRLFIGGFLLTLFFALPGCTQNPENHLVEVKHFVDLTRRDFQTLGKRLAPLLVQTDRSEKVDEAIREFFSDAEDLAGRPNLGIAVLDGRMNYIAGRSISTDHPDAAPIQTSLRDFSYLKDLFNAAGEGIAHQSLYYQNREIFTVCSTIGSGEKTDAYICLFYDAKMFRKVFGFGKPVFARIDFSR